MSAAPSLSDYLRAPRADEPDTLSRRAGPRNLDASVAFWIVIVIVCAAGAVCLLTFPRAVARLGPGGGWADGHILRT